MQIDGWLRISVHKRPGYSYFEGKAEYFKKKPTCSDRQIAIEMSINIPDTLFERPSLAISLTVPDPQVALEIDVEMLRGIEQLIQQNLGVTAHVSVADDLAEQQKGSTSAASGSRGHSTRWGAR